MMTMAEEIERAIRRRIARKQGGYYICNFGENTIEVKILPEKEEIHVMYISDPIDTLQLKLFVNTIGKVSKDHGFTAMMNHSYPSLVQMF